MYNKRAHCSVIELESSPNQLKSSIIRQHACNMKKNGIRELGKVNLENSLIQLESSLI